MLLPPLRKYGVIREVCVCAWRPSPFFLPLPTHRASALELGTAVGVEVIGVAAPSRPHPHHAGLAAAMLATSEEFTCTMAAVARVWILHDFSPCAFVVGLFS